MLFKPHDNCLRSLFLLFEGRQVSGTNESDYRSRKYLAGIAVLIILLVISCVIIAYFICQTRKNLDNETKPETTNDASDSSHIYEIPFTDSYENIDDDHFKYTDLKFPAPGEPSDDHAYGHLNETAV